MSWNYRIIFHNIDSDVQKHWYGLHEVYYKNDEIFSWTEKPVTFISHFDEPDGILNELENAFDCSKKYPVLLLSELEKNIKNDLEDEREKFFRKECRNQEVWEAFSTGFLIFILVCIILYIIY